MMFTHAHVITHFTFQKTGDVNGLLLYIISVFGSLFMQYNRFVKI
jgi:hypothetical protein